MPGPLNDTRAQTDRAVKDAELKIMDFIGTSMIYWTPSYRNKALPSLPSLCTTRYSFLRAPRRISCDPARRAKDSSPVRRHWERDGPASAPGRGGRTEAAVSFAACTQWGQVVNMRAGCLPAQLPPRFPDLAHLLSSPRFRSPCAPRR